MSTIKITNEDCMDLMKRTPDNYYELAICDPPYGIDFGSFNRTNKDSSGNRYKANKYKGGDWDKGIPNEEYFTELMRVSKNQIIWGGNYFPLPPTQCFIFWYKQNPVANFSDGELAWTSFKRPASCFDYRQYGNIEGKSSAPTKIHPTQKPVALYKWLLSNYATCKKCNNTGIIQEFLGEKWMGSTDVDCEYCDIYETKSFKILDTHLGSGSIAIACHDLGFDLDACEIDKDYYEAAVKRYKQHAAQGNMFASQPEKKIHEQNNLFR